MTEGFMIGRKIVLIIFAIYCLTVYSADTFEEKEKINESISLIERILIIYEKGRNADFCLPLEINPQRA